MPKKERNIWVECSAYPSLFHDTGLEFISVEYPFSRWYKPVNAAFKAHGSRFKLKRGQPMYCMRFRGGKNNAYDLRRWKDAHPPEELKVKLNQHQSLKQWVKGVSWGLIKKDEEENVPLVFSEMTVINYTPNYQTIKATASMQQTDMNHPLFIPEYYIKPVTYLEYTQKDNEKHSFYKCPAWKSYWANTFVVFNQLDISFSWEKETGRVYDTSFPEQCC